MSLTSAAFKRAYRIKEIVSELGVSRGTVRNWIANGRVLAYKLDGVVFIDGDSYRGLLESAVPIVRRAKERAA